MNMFLLFFLSILVVEVSVCTALKYNMWASPTIGKYYEAINAHLRSVFKMFLKPLIGICIVP